jgi:Flp pilus assembly protein TadG
MCAGSLILRFRRHARNLWSAQDGDVAVIFALLLIPLIGLTGGAIDYTRASAAKVAMQAALDATALAVSKEAASLTPSQLSQRATDYFMAAFNRPDAQNVSVNMSYSNTAGSTIVLTSTGVVKSHFLGILGIDQMNISTTTKTKWGTKSLRVTIDGKHNVTIPERGAFHRMRESQICGATAPAVHNGPWLLTP